MHAESPRHAYEHCEHAYVECCNTAGTAAILWTASAHQLPGVPLSPMMMPFERPYRAPPSCIVCAFCLCLSLPGAVLHLDGMGAFDAATHCASLTAAERQKRENTTQTSSSNSSHSDVHMQQEQEQQQQFSSRGHSRAGGVASVQLQVSSHHSTAHSCPRSTVQQDTAMVPRPSVHQAL